MLVDFRSMTRFAWAALLLQASTTPSVAETGSACPPSDVYLWRMRKAGSGSLDDLVRRYAKVTGSRVVPNAATTMHSMDGDCALGAWKRQGLLTMTHAREPLAWQTTLYYYAGAGSKLVPPDRRDGAVADDDERLWSAWMAETDARLRPPTCATGWPEGYGKPKTLHSGFGAYVPNFLTRALAGRCGCGDDSRSEGGVERGFCADERYVAGTKGAKRPWAPGATRGFSRK